MRAAIVRTRTKKLPSNPFNIVIPVKPYVKRFLELNYGDPVYFHPDKQDYDTLRDCLRDSRKKDSRFPLRICTYSTEITVVLSERDFYRYGWEMSHANVVKFNSYFERRAKTLMRSMISVYHGLGLPIHICVNKFQDRFYFDENVWPYHSIKKDFYRNGYKQTIDFDNEIFLKVEKIILTNLSTLETITPNFIKDHENDK